MPVSGSQLRLILSTAGSRDEAERIAHALVHPQLAACVNIVPGLQSIYRWQGKVESAEEVLLLIKTTVANLDRVESALRAAHSYEMPEFLVLTPESGGKDYVRWLLESSQPPQ